MSTHNKEAARRKIEFLLSVGLLSVTWLFLTGWLISVWIRGVGDHINIYSIIFIAILVSAWAFIPIQIVRYFRGRHPR